MKKLFITLSAVIMALSLNATDLWTGSQHVKWTTPLNLEADTFSNATAGQKLVVTFENASDGIEFKSNGKNIVGSRREAWISGDGTYELYLTEFALEAIQNNGLEIVGANFVATKVELLDGKTLKEGKTLWTGSFLAGKWQTLYLYTEGFNVIDFSKVEAIRFYSEAAGDDFDFNFRSAWKPEAEGYIADRNNVNISFGEGYMNLNLDDEMRSKLTNANQLIIQYNTDGKPTAAFNVTDVVLVINDDPTGIDNTNADAKAIKSFRNGMLVIEKNGKFYNALGAELK